jgi:hypothetical protein
MHRTEPPPQATWLLEHLTSGARNDALAGDLLEEFRAGRSHGWYWRQVSNACLVSWTHSLALRGPMLVFALFWSALAPAWEVVVDRLWKSEVAFAWPAALVGWIALNATFLWAGVLVYLIACTFLGKAIRRPEAHRAFAIALLIFPPVAFAIFVLANLYWYSVPGLAEARLAGTSLAQLADFSILANLIRIPYCIALVSALWNSIPTPKRKIPSLSDGRKDDLFTNAGAIAFASAPDPFTVRQFFAFMVGAGLINALIAGFALCRLPGANNPSIASLLCRAACYVAIGAAAGVIGAYLYWQNPWSPFREKTPVPFPLFALVCASGWVWIPSIVIFSEALSAGAALAAMIAALLLASGLRNATYFVLAPATSGPTSSDALLFEESLYRAPADLVGFAIALCLYTALVALAARWILSAATLVALAAALFGWKKTVPQGPDVTTGREYKRATLRMAFAVMPAILVSAWALLDGVAYRNRVQAALDSTSPSLTAPRSIEGKQNPLKPANGVGGYESVILWPYPETKQIVAPVLHTPSFLVPGTLKPIVLRFTGAYWYLQPPHQLPGLMAHQAHGSPLRTKIESSDDIPLVMDAHQDLPAVIPLARCREIDIDVENDDNRQGPIAVALLLGVGPYTAHQTVYLGQQQIVSSLPQHFQFKSTPVTETLRFAVPAKASLQGFNEITVMILPGTEHLLVAPRIALRQFQFFAR